MPLFFIHQRRTSTYIPDPEGAEFPSLAQAREEAILAARETVREMARAGVIDLTIAFEIEGPDGQRAIVPFSEVITVRT
jgi:hypothetical protein